MRRLPAFTLLETLIALVILVVVLGAGVVTYRAVAGAGGQRQELSQMNALADQALSSVRLVRDSKVGSPYSSLASAFGLTGTTSYARYVTFVANSGSLSPCVGGSGSACSLPADSGPIALGWCSMAVGGTDVNCSGVGNGSVVSPVGIDDSSHSGYNCSPNCHLSTLYTQLGGKELVAVRQVPCLSSSSSPDCNAQGKNNPQVVSLDRPLDPSSVSTTIFTSHYQAWNFYTRSIKIASLNVLAAPPFLCQTGQTVCYSPVPNDAPDATLRQQTYLVTVSVQNYYNPQVQLTKSMLLTDSNTLP